MTALICCPTCRRHVRVEEEVCPFCSGSPLGAAAPRTGAARYLKRAAVIAVGAALSTACTAQPPYGEPPDTGPRSVDAGPNETDAGPIETDAGPIETDAGPIDAGNIAPPYGAPVSTEFV